MLVNATFTPLFLQELEVTKAILGKKLTFTVSFAEVNGVFAIRLQYYKNGVHTSSTPTETAISNGKLTVTMDIPNDAERVYAIIESRLATTANSYCVVKNAKLEEGSTSTPFKARLYGEELALCQRYGEPLPAPCYARPDNSYVVNGSYKVSKRTTPTLKFKSVNGVDGKLSYWNSSSWIDVPIANTDWTYSNGYSYTLNSTGISGAVLVQGNIFADSEIY